MGRPRGFGSGPMEHYAVRVPKQARKALLKNECTEQVREFILRYLELEHPESGPYRVPGEGDVLLKYRIISTQGGDK